MRTFGITPKLTLVFVLFAGAVLLGLSIPAYNNGRTALEAATVSELLTTALEKQAALDTWVADRQHSMGDIANQAQLRETATALMAAAPGSSDAGRAQADLVKDLENWAGEGQRFLSMEVIDAATGRIVAATDAIEEGKFREGQPYFINGLQAAYVQNPYYDLARQRPGMTAAAPVLSPEGRVIAVLAGLLNMDEMNAIIQRRSGLHQTDDAFLVNTSSLFVTQPRLDSDPAVLLRGIHTEAVNRCLAHNTGVVAYNDYRDVPVIGNYRWLPERQLCLITKIDQNEAFAPSRALASTMALTGGLVLLIGSIVALGMSRTITRPVRHLVLGAEQIGLGNLDYRIEVKSGDEIGKLGIALNEMAVSLSEKEAQLHQYASQLEHKVEERTAALQLEIGERKRAEAEILRRNHELAALYAISRATAQSLNLDETLNRAVEATLGALDIETGGIYLVEPDGETLTLRVHRGVSDEVARNLQRVKLGEGMSGRAAAEKQPVVLDVQDYPSQQLAPYIIQERLQSLASIPLLSAGQAVGALNLSTRRVRAFPPEELELLTAIGQQLGNAVQNARLYETVQRELTERKHSEEELARRNRELTVLYTIRRAIGQSLDLRQVLTEAVKVTLEALRIEGGVIMLIDPDGQTLTMHVQHGLSEEFAKDLEHIKIGEGLAGKAVSEKQPVVLDLSEYPTKRLAPFMVKEGFQTMTSTPLMSAGVALGAMSLGTRRVRAFPPEEMDLLKGIGELLGGAVQNAQLYEQVQQELAERKRAAETLHKSEERYRTLAEASQDMVFVLGSDDTFQYINNVAARHMGSTPGELIGQPLARLFPPETVEQQQRGLRAVFETGQAVQRESRIIFPGHTVWVSTWLAPLRNAAGSVQAVMGVARDITERKSAEEKLKIAIDDLARSNAELERFAYVASHDLQEPLRMVTSYLQLLERRYKEKLDGDALEFINYAVDGSNRMKTLISDLLAYSRVSTHRKEFVLTDCEEILGHVLSTLQISIEESRGQVTHDPLPKVMADTAQVESLFQNLIGNAIKFHGKNPPKIHVGVKKDEKDWVFWINDNGIGIDPQYFERIFIIFQRLHNRQDYPGTGIGLAISKRIVERHGGRMWIESQPEKGSTFFFTLPIRGESQ